MQDFLAKYFLETGLGWAMIGAAVAVMMGCIGSARGIRIAAAQAAGVMSEKPELFGKLLVLMALPGTQGFYALVCAILVGRWTGLFDGKALIHPVIGLSMMAIAAGTGFVLWKSAVFQGETSAAAINMVSKKPETSGRAILMPALVETYALVALLGAIVLMLFLKGVEFA